MGLRKVRKMSDIKVLVLVGSLRAASVNRQLAELAVESAPDGVRLQLFDRLGELPFYNEDIDNENVAESVVALRRGGGRRGRGPGRHPGIQRQHSRCAQERNRLAVEAVWQQRIQGQADGGGRCCARSYGGVWAHDETRKSFGIAGPRVVEDLKLSLRTTVFDGKHPRENAEVAATLRDIVGKLAAEVS